MRSRSRCAATLLALVLLGVTITAVTTAPGTAAAAAKMAPATSTARSRGGTVVKIVDGDTIHVQVDGHVEKVRYVGVNTPEVRHPTRGEEAGGREAAAVNRGLVAGRHVRLELDVQERDRYGRLLAYVWVGDVMVNAELVRRGYAQVMTVPPNVRHQAMFLALERAAREAGRGLWRRA